MAKNRKRRIRTNLSLNSDVRTMGENLAREDVRSLSGFVEQLVLNEHRRRQSAKAKA